MTDTLDPQVMHDLGIITDRGLDPLAIRPRLRPRHGPTRFDLPPDNPARLEASTPAALAILADIESRRGLYPRPLPLGDAVTPPLCPDCGDPMYARHGRWHCSPCEARRASERALAQQVEAVARLEELVGRDVVVSWVAMEDDTDGTIRGRLEEIESVEVGWALRVRCRIGGCQVEVFGADIQAAG